MKRRLARDQQSASALAVLNHFTNQMQAFDYRQLYNCIYELKHVPESREYLEEGEGYMTLEQDWSQAVWQRYSEITLLSAVVVTGHASDFSRYNRLISQTLNAILILPEEQRQNMINRLQMLSQNMLPLFCLDRFSAEHLKNRDVSLRSFHGLIKETLRTSNYPKTEKGDAYLYIDNVTFDTAYISINQKVSAINELVRQVAEITGLATIDEAVAPLNEPSLPDWVKRKNEFNNAPLIAVRNYFMQLAAPAGKREVAFLTPDQVDIFIRKAFLNEGWQPEQKLNVGKRDQVCVRSLFYKFYTDCTTKESIAMGIEGTIQCKDKYVRLLTDNFTNYDKEKIEQNFAKTSGTTNWKSVTELG